ncbi:MAG: hypothetical protein LBE22_10450 [Azoarcus sp.]|jgi:hypothetical protein|nr:hypothetical protein [Azoarcus sp.]
MNAAVRCIDCQHCDLETAVTEHRQKGLAACKVGAYGRLTEPFWLRVCDKFEKAEKSTVEERERWLEDLRWGRV